MKTKLFRGALSALLVVCMLASSAAAAVPEESETVQPYYVGISTFVVDFSITGGTANCYASVSISNDSNSGKLFMHLQRSSDGVNWSNLVNWSESGSGFIYLDKDRTVNSGYYYRIHCSANVYDANGALLGINTKTSSTVYY